MEKTKTVDLWQENIRNIREKPYLNNLQSCSPSNWCGPPVPANLKASVINFLRNSSSVKSPRGAAIRSQRLTIASMPAAFATTSVTSVHQDVVWLCASNLGVQPKKIWGDHIQRERTKTPFQILCAMIRSCCKHQKLVWKPSILMHTLISAEPELLWTPKAINLQTLLAPELNHSEFQAVAACPRQQEPPQESDWRFKNDTQVPLRN